MTGLRGNRRINLEVSMIQLKNRQQFFRLNDISSSPKQTSIGVPQGRNPGPISFLIYIQDLADVSSNLNRTLFSDDTTVTLCCENLPCLISQHNQDLNKLTDWAIQNCLTIKTNKREPMMKEFDICQFWPLQNTSSVQLSYFAYR